MLFDQRSVNVFVCLSSCTLSGSPLVLTFEITSLKFPELLSSHKAPFAFGYMVVFLKVELPLSSFILFLHFPCSSFSLFLSRLLLSLFFPLHIYCFIVHSVSPLLPGFFSSFSALSVTSLLLLRLSMVLNVN